MAGGQTELRTERLRLRPPEPRDLEPFALMCADPEVMRHIGLGRPVDRASAELGFATLMERWRRDGTGLFTVEDVGTGEYLGFVGTAPVPPSSVAAGEIEIGWRLRRGAWGRGLAVEGARAVGAHVADVHEVARVVALVRPENTRSRRVAEKLGLVEERTGRGPRGETVVVYGGPPPR
jgi:RimJ/RimL family protein N-acetyltransferase